MKPAKSTFIVVNESPQSQSFAGDNSILAGFNSFYWFLLEYLMNLMSIEPLISLSGLLIVPMKSPTLVNVVVPPEKIIKANQQSCKFMWFSAASCSEPKNEPYPNLPEKKMCRLRSTPKLKVYGIRFRILSLFKVVAHS